MRKAFTLLELVVIIVVVIILASIALQRYGVMKRAAALSRNTANVNIIVEALSRYQLNGNVLTNITTSSTIENVTSQLIQAGFLEPNSTFTSAQIFMWFSPVAGDYPGLYDTNSPQLVDGTMYFAPTYDPY